MFPEGYLGHPLMAFHSPTLTMRSSLMSNLQMEPGVPWQVVSLHPWDLARDSKYTELRGHFISPKSGQILIKKGKSLEDVLVRMKELKRFLFRVNSALSTMIEILG